MEASLLAIRVFRVSCSELKKSVATFRSSLISWIIPPISALTIDFTSSLRTNLKSFIEEARVVFNFSSSKALIFSIVTPPLHPEQQGPGSVVAMDVVLLSCTSKDMFMWLSSIGS